jgi:hypothetical protein
VVVGPAAAPDPPTVVVGTVSVPGSRKRKMDATVNPAAQSPSPSLDLFMCPYGKPDLWK